MNILVDYNHTWETQYNQQFIIDTDKLDMENLDHKVVADTINAALAVDEEENGYHVSDDVSEIIENLFDDPAFSWSKKGKKIDNEITLWWGEE